MFLEGQIDYVQARGFEVHVICSPDHELQQFAERNHLMAHGVRISRKLSPLQDLKSVWNICRVLRQIRPDVLVAHMSKAGLLGIIAGRLSGNRVRIYHNHGMALFALYGWRRWMLERCERLTCRLATKVLSVSESQRDQIVAAGICPRDKIKSILAGSIDGIDAIERFNPSRFDAQTKATLRQACSIPAGALVIGFVGRMLPDKGVAELVTTWKTLRESYPSAQLLVLGDFDLRQDLLPETKNALQNDPRIHLTGFVKEPAPYYSLMDLVVLPSYHEGFGLVLLESAAMGLPTVASRIPGIVNAVKDGETGTLVEPRDPRALTEAIRAYLDDPNLRRRHGQAGRDRALRAFKQQPIRDALYQEYLAALSSGRVA